ncbi:hypothetical protein BDN70DRAFT_662847 [Pholiota conissans]|uniref:BTB domain-containing protein n=1 Tax=Pholiota conissans TaxID=109636 RepID=A0A9P5YKX7_9AGAR|nr:hypothetical protein BDN70DRAFT_662847 [Pholiota conissans]
MNTKDIPEATPIEEEECEVDDLYYFDLVIFKVENKLFRVPKVGLNVEGTPFEAMFTLPQSTPVEGSTDKNPIILQGEGITKANFRAFLRVLYPITDVPLTHEELTGAMELAIMWNFSKARTCPLSRNMYNLLIQPVLSFERASFKIRKCPCSSKRSMSTKESYTQSNVKPSDGYLMPIATL